MSDTTWPQGVILVDPQGIVNHDDALRVAQGIASARPPAVHYTDPWIIAPAFRQAGKPAALLIYRVSWNSGWEGWPLALIRRVQDYYRNHQ